MWARLSAITDANNDIDFTLRVDDEFPMYVIDSCPLFVMDPGTPAQGEGRP